MRPWEVDRLSTPLSKKLLWIQFCQDEFEKEKMESIDKHGGIKA